VGFGVSLKSPSFFSSEIFFVGENFEPKTVMCPGGMTIMDDTGESSSPLPLPVGFILFLLFSPIERAELWNVLSLLGGMCGPLQPLLFKILFLPVLPRVLRANL